MQLLLCRRMFFLAYVDEFEHAQVSTLIVIYVVQIEEIVYTAEFVECVRGSMSLVVEGATRPRVFIPHVWCIHVVHISV